jgi:hypothetical protein
VARAQQGCEAQLPDIARGAAAGFLLCPGRVRGTAIIALALVSGCQGYQAGTFRHFNAELAGERRTVGCLDVAVADTNDAEALGPVAGITIANRCDVAVTVDIGAIRATGRRPDGDVIALRAYDPAWEIRPARLEARSVATEYIEYQPPPQQELLFTEWCLDLARVDAKRPSDAPVLVCFANGVRA